jgi:predicted transcriptional regulator
MKAAVSIPDDLYARAECLARRLNKSRSRLYAEAVREYVTRHDPDAVTEALNRVHDSTDSSIDAALASAGTQLLKQVEW